MSSLYVKEMKKIATILGLAIAAIIIGVMIFQKIESNSIEAMKTSQREAISGWIEDDLALVNANLAELERKSPDWKSKVPDSGIRTEDTRLWGDLINLKNRIWIYTQHVDFYLFVLKEEYPYNENVHKTLASIDRLLEPKELSMSK